MKKHKDVEGKWGPASLEDKAVISPDLTRQLIGSLFQHSYVCARKLVFCFYLDIAMEENSHQSQRRVLVWSAKL